MLFTERATRGSSRSFVRYHDLLADWTSTVVRVGEELGLAEVTDAGTGKMQEVHRFVDPSCTASRTTWDDLSVPDSLREIAEATWQQLDLLAEPGGDTPEVHAKLDVLRRDVRRPVRRGRGDRRLQCRRRRAGVPRGDPQGRRGRGRRAAAYEAASAAAQGLPAHPPGRWPGEAPAAKRRVSERGRQPSGGCRTSRASHDYEVVAARLRRPRAGPHRGASGEERGPQPAVGAAAAVRGGPARGRRRQPVRRRHARGGPRAVEEGGRRGSGSPSRSTPST